MDDRLKGLRKSMEHTVFNNVSFDKEKSIDNVLNAKRAKNELFGNKTFFLLKRRMTGLLGIIVCAGLLIFTYQTVRLNHNKSSGASSNTNSHSVVKTKSPNSTSVKDTRNLSKQDLLIRMMNTVDNFSSVQGTYSYTQNGSNNKLTISYALEMKGNSYKSYSKDVSEYKRTHDISYSYSNGHQITMISPKFKQYQPFNTTYNKGNALQLKDIMSLKERNRPFTDATESLFNWEFIQRYLVANKNWSIISENEEMFGYKTVVVKGSYKSKFPNNYGTSFKVWVNRATGIILKYECYDNKGNVVTSLNTTNFKLNSSIDSSIFNFNIPNGYKNINQHNQSK